MFDAFVNKELREGSSPYSLLLPLALNDFCRVGKVAKGLYSRRP